MKEKVDVFVGNHVWNNKTDKKIELLQASEQNPFIDPSEWEAFLKERMETIKRVIENNE